MKDFIIILIIFSTFISSSVFAQISTQDISACATIPGELDRLECYDNIARNNGLDGPQPNNIELDGVGKWDVDVETNPLDDSTTVTLFLIADEGQSSFREPVIMVARCMSDETDLYIVWNDYLGSEAYVTHRIGQNDSVRYRWSLSTDSQATFYANARTLLEEMVGEERFVAQVTPYNESPVTAIFDIAGLENAISPLRETCGW